MRKTKLTEVKKKIEANPTALFTDDKLPPEIMQMLEDKMPPWVKELATNASAVLQWNLEYLIVLEEILRLDFDFTEDDLIRVEKRLKEVLPIAHKMKLEEPHQIRKGDLLVIMEMIERNKQLMSAQKAGIKLPSSAETRELLEKNKK